MNTLGKAAIGVSSTGTACTGGYFVCRECFFSNGSSTTPTKSWKSLSTTSNYGEGTLGKIYGENLLDPFDRANIEKWNENYQKAAEDENSKESPPKPKLITDGEFQVSVVSQGFSEESNTTVTNSLNKVCKTHYEKQMETEGESDNTKIQIGSEKWKVIWLLCSEWNPTTLGDNPDNYPANSIGKTKGKELLSTQNSANEELWKRKNQKFFSLPSAPTEKPFQDLYTENKDKENSLKLRDKCEGTYQQIPSPEQDGSPKAEDVIKYCSLRSF